MGPPKPPKYPTQGPTWQTVEPMKVGAPPVRVEPDVLEFGDLRAETRVSGEFKLTNTGTERLQILAAMSSCNCTAADLRERAIEPGKTITLPVTFDSGAVIAEQNREVVIRFVGYSKSVVAKVHAFTNYGIRATVDYSPQDQRRLGVVVLQSPDNEAFRVVSANGKAPEYADDFDPSMGARGRYELRLDLSEYLPERLPKWFVIETDDPDSPIIDIPVENLEWEPERAIIPWWFGEMRVMLGVMAPASQRDIVLTVKNVAEGGLDFLTSLWAEPPIADVSLFGMEQTPDGLKLRMRVAPKDSPPGRRGIFITKIMVAGLEYEDGVMLMGRIVDPASEEAQ